MKALATAALLALATAAAAQPNAGSGAGSTEADGNQSGTATTSRQDDSERLICRWVRDSDSGSLVRGRLRRCLTLAQWRALDR